MLNGKWDLLGLLKANREGSHETQATRRDTVTAFIRTLDQNGFSQAVRKRGFKIKEKHVRRCVGVWRNEDKVSTRTIEKRLSHLRSMCRWQGTPGILRSNTEYLPRREKRRTAKASKRAPDGVDWRKARTAHGRASLRLQKGFGLRRKEACLVQPWRSPADNSRLVLHRQSTKGGRYREIPARTQEQREALAFAKLVAGGGSLVPPTKSYRQWRDEYRREAELAGLPNGSTHALRFAYAEDRYRELSGMLAPVAGGPWKVGGMNAEERAADGQARDELSGELGHGRRAVVAQYVGGASPA